MAVVSGTMLRYDANGLREDLSDVIYNISPEETPFISSASREDVDQTLFEWQTDSLASTDTGNAQLEGDDASFSTPAATTRVGNYTQISRKTLILSGTLEEIDKAGRRSELAYQIAKRGRELRRDMEAIALENLAGNAGGSTTARQTATLNAWLQTNTDREGTGADSGHTSGVPTSAATDGANRAFTETILRDVAESAWTNGGDPSMLMVGPFNKRVVSGFTGVVTRNFDISGADPTPKATAVIAAVDVYVHDFGVLRVVPNRFQRERDAWFLDPEFYGLGILRGMRTEELAKTGDAEKRMLLTEWGLKVKNEAALGLAADLNTA